MKLLITLLALLSSTTSNSQIYINYNEAELRSKFSPTADKIEKLSVSGENTLVVQLYSSVYAFKLNKLTNLCDSYVVRIDDPQIVSKWISDFSNRYTTIVEGQKWTTKHKNILITIVRRLSSSQNSTSFLFYK